MGEIVKAEPIGPGALAQISTADTLAQVQVAQNNRRKLSLVMERTLEVACINERTAAACFYRLPRGGKMIDGPSIRLAEIMATSFGNLRVSAHVAEITRSEVIAVGICLDLESNTAFQAESRRTILDKYGNRFPEHLIQTTANAAVSIAMRNAIFRVIPGPIVEEIHERVKEAASGKGALEEKRKRALAAFSGLGAEETEVLRLVKARRIEDVKIDDVLTLRGYYVAIKDGETTLPELLEAVEAKPKAARQKADERRSALFDRPPVDVDASEPASTPAHDHDPRDEDAP